MTFNKIIRLCKEHEGEKVLVATFKEYPYDKVVEGNNNTAQFHTCQFYAAQAQLYVSTIGKEGYWKMVPKKLENYPPKKVIVEVNDYFCTLRLPLEDIIDVTTGDTIRQTEEIEGEGWSRLTVGFIQSTPHISNLAYHTFSSTDVLASKRLPYFFTDDTFREKVKRHGDLGSPVLWPKNVDEQFAPYHVVMFSLDPLKKLFGESFDMTNWDGDVAYIRNEVENRLAKVPGINWEEELQRIMQKNVRLIAVDIFDQIRLKQQKRIDQDEALTSALVDSIFHSEEDSKGIPSANRLTPEEEKRVMDVYYKHFGRSKEEEE